MFRASKSTVALHDFELNTKEYTQAKEYCRFKKRERKVGKVQVNRVWMESCWLIFKEFHDIYIVWMYGCSVANTDHTSHFDCCHIRNGIAVFFIFFFTISLSVSHSYFYCSFSSISFGIVFFVALFCFYAMFLKRFYICVEIKEIEEKEESISVGR